MAWFFRIVFLSRDYPGTECRLLRPPGPSPARRIANGKNDMAPMWSTFCEEPNKLPDASTPYQLWFMCFTM